MAYRWPATNAPTETASYPHIDAGFLQNAHFGWLLGCFGAATRRASRIFYITTKARHHLFYALSAPQISFRASRARRLVGVAIERRFPIVWMGLLVLSQHVGLREVRGSVSCVVAE